MATTTTSLLPNQQQTGEIESNTQGASSNASNSSGSIGPFFAVISVLTILAIISCILGRMRTRGTMTMTPLDSIKHGGCLGWFKRKCWCCMTGDVEVGAKVMAFGDDGKAKNDEIQHPPQA